jgi:DNA-binding transcriptional LysR family regulator
MPVRPSGPHSAGVMAVDLRVMRYVVAVAEEGGFQDAAARLHVAQPALSRQVAQLERELGVELFARRPTRITEPGQAFVDGARRILAEVERVVAHTRLVARGEVGVVRIGHTLTAAFDALPRLLDHVYREHPRVEVETGRRWDAELVTGLDEGRFDVAVGHQLARLPGLASLVLCRERFAAVLPAEHPLAGRPAVCLHDLQGETFRFLPRRLAPLYHDLVVSAVQGAGVTFDVWPSADPWLGCHAIADLGGFTVVPASVGARLPGGVTCLPLVDPVPAVDLVVLWRPDAVLPPAELVVKAAHQLAGDTGDTGDPGRPGDHGAAGFLGSAGSVGSAGPVTPSS